MSSTQAPCRKRDVRRRICTTYLATTQNLVTREVEDIGNELRYRVTTDPKEERLAVFDEEKAVTLEPF